MRWNDRLAELVRRQGLSKAELHRRSGVSYDNINKYLRGEVENPRGDALDRLARAVGTTVVYLRDGLTDRKPLSTDAVPYRGVVAAGIWIEASEGLVDPEEWLPYNPAPQYPAGAVYCLTVQGDSLDKIAPPGATLVCVDFTETGMTFADGDLVIVERTKDQGGLIEMTAKRVRAVAGGHELYPESSNPRWQPYFIPADHSATDAAIRVIARVEFIMRKP